MAHDHSHHHSGNYNRAFAIGVALNVIFVVIEGVWGILAGSLALIADAGHNLSDVASLLLAWGGALLATKSTTRERTYGYRKATVMASMISALLLLMALGGISWEAVKRFANPAPVDSLTIIVVAAIGVVINTATALLFFSGQKQDLNIRGAFLHMTADAAISLGVAVAGIFIMVSGWLWIDPVVSLIIVAVIFFGTWELLRDSVNYSLDAVPRGTDIDGIKHYLAGLDQVEHFHDLHVWPLSTSEVALTVHLVVSNNAIDNAFLLTIQQHLHDKFGIEHATIQIESVRSRNVCLLDRADCV